MSYDLHQADAGGRPGFSRAAVRSMTDACLGDDMMSDSRTAQQWRRRPTALAVAAALLLGLAGAPPARAEDPDAIDQSAATTAPVPLESPESSSSEPSIEATDDPATEPGRPADPAEAPAQAPQTEPPVDLPAVVRIKGVLRVVALEPSGHAVTLLTEEGTAVELSGAALAGTRSGDRFDGTVTIEQGVAQVIEQRAAEQSLPTSPSGLSEQVAEASASLDKPLRVAMANIGSATSPVVPARAHTVDVMFAHAEGQDLPSTATVDAMVARLSEFWNSQSNGQVSGFTRPVAVKFAKLPKDHLCDPYWLWDYAAGPAGFNRGESYYWAGSTATHLLVLSSGGSCSDGFGLGTSGRIHSGGTAWAAVGADPLDWDQVTFHEIGHNLGLGHSAVTFCPAPPTVDGPSCEVNTYEDYYDVMGGGYTYTTGRTTYRSTRNVAALNVTHKVVLDALARGSALREVRSSGGGTQQFTLAPASATSGIRGLEIIDPINSDKLYVEYRSGTGRDAASFYTHYSADHPDDSSYAPGVRVLKFAADESTVLLRWTGSDSASLSHGPGDEFRSRSRAATGLAGVQLSVISMDASGAVVQVGFGSQLSIFNTPTVTITGTPQHGHTLTAGLSPAWSPVPDSTSYQWLRDGVPISGAASPTYRVGAADLERELRVRITAYKSGYASQTISAAITPNTVYTPITISGTVSLPAGVPASAREGMVVRAFGDSMPSAWPQEHATGVDPETGNYTLTDLPPGRWRLYVTPANLADVSAQWYGGALSHQTSTVVDRETSATGINFALTRSKRISGTVQLPPGSPASWLPLVAVTAEPEAEEDYLVLGRTGYTVVAPDGSFEISGLDAGRYLLSTAPPDYDFDTWEPTGLVMTWYGGVSEKPLSTPIDVRAGNAPGRDIQVLRPVASAVPTISGTPRVGVTLTAHPGNWGPGTAFAYQWAAGGTNVAGATGSTFVPRQADVGKTVTVAVTGSRTQYTPVTQVSAPTAAVTDASLRAGTPSISGIPQVGVTLIAVPGDWDPAATLSYQWLVGEAAVSGATGITFVPRQADVGKPVSVQVTGTRVGYDPAVRASAATGNVLPLATLTAKTPTISGTARIGVTLTAKPWTWTPGTTLTYQWRVAGKPVPGATRATFVPRSADKGKTVTVQVTGSKPGYHSATVTSKATKKVLPLLKLKTKTPTISGKPKVGGKLTAKPGKWTSGTMFTYKWTAGGKTVAGATSATFYPTAKHLKKTIKVKVTGTKAGYKTTSKTSKATKKVAK